MNENKTSCAPADNQLTLWDSIDWTKAELAVRKLQARIVKAQKDGRHNKMKALQWTLTHTFYAKALAVKRVTSNGGGNTPGVDMETWDKPETKMQAINDLRRRGYQPKPLRRVHIKKSNGKLRPLGIPTMKDRAMQALYLMALEPVSETTADTRSYGFRKERRCMDAVMQCHNILRKGYSPEWILEGDIKGCFDHISHEWLLANIPMDKAMLRKWLKCGYIFNKQMFPTEEGTPQGGIISPTLANMALDGLQKVLAERYKRRTIKGKHYSPMVNLVRYADDFIITCENRETLENEIKPLVAEFMAERGLTLSEEKLDPYEGKLSSTVLRGEEGSNALDLPDRPSDLEQRNGRAVRKGNLIAKEFADNKVDVIIYAVERSLDSYKFNLLHNKQLFINQLKTNTLGSRTIDEGSMDEDSGMNFSEYVAVLSGNTDLLEKAKLDKKITTLESERKNFLRERDAATGKLAEIESSVSFHSDKIKEAQSDLGLFEQRVERDTEGLPVNKLTIKGLEECTDIKVIAARLHEIEEKARTKGDYNKIGEIYGFSIMVKTENSSKELFDCSSNRFFVKGQESIYYTYNNGRLATDPKLACENFVNALERIPKVIESHEKEMAKIVANKDVYINIAGGSWKKEDELRALKSEAAELDRKIVLTLAPTEEEEKDETEEKKHEHGESLQETRYNIEPISRQQISEVHSSAQDSQTLLDDQNVMSRVVISKSKWKM